MKNICVRAKFQLNNIEPKGKLRDVHAITMSRLLRKKRAVFYFETKLLFTKNFRKKMPPISDNQSHSETMQIKI